MNHFRIATYDVVKGTSKEVAELALGPGGIHEIYRSMPGFQAYSLIEKIGKSTRLYSSHVALSRMPSSA